MKMRLYCLSAAMISVAIISQARGSWNIDNTIYHIDTLYHATAGPGTSETHLRVTSSASGEVNNLFYTTVQLDNPYVEMRAAKAGNSMSAVETVPEIAERFSRPGEIYFAGTNADFFNTAHPYNALGATITNGSLANLNTPAPAADIDDYFLYFDGNNTPSFARHVVPNSQGSIQFPDGSQYIHTVNTSRGTDGLVLYTPQWKTGNYATGYTGTNMYGTEVKVRPVDGPILYGNNQELEVIEAPVRSVGNMKIPDDGFVVSAHGTAQTHLTGLKKGDIIKAYIGIRADNTPATVKELIGGFPFILRDNAIEPTPSYPEHLSGKEPRTAVGHNHDKSQLIMLVVDGRNAGGSAGVTQNMLAKFMLQLGSYDAMNFDGGGSSTLYIDRLGVRNVPSSSSLDPSRPTGQPRVVVNALFAVAKAPDDSEIASIEIREKRLDLSTGQSYRPTVYGYNRSGGLVDTDVTGFTCETAPQLGTFDGTTFTAGSGRYRGDFTVRLGEATHSIPAFINGNDGEYVNSGVDNIMADPDINAPVEYYTPLGQRITRPTPGQIIIERQGTRVTRRLYR
ncbi:MAG: phosphodiester glycosidase family protein [Muribaculaceae bacterium]|nr:phosphodiester glycosidase family protein [Muribaculaceae bacterium]